MDPKKGFGPPLSDDDIDFLLAQAFPPKLVKVQPAPSMSLQDREELQAMFVALQAVADQPVVVTESGVGVSLQDAYQYARRIGWPQREGELAEMDLDLNGYIEEAEFVEFMFSARVKAMEDPAYRLDKRLQNASDAAHHDVHFKRFVDESKEGMTKFLSPQKM